MDYNLPSLFQGVKIISSEVSDGSMDREHIFKNLPKFLIKNNVHLPVAYCEQVHSAEIKIITSAGMYEGCDGLMAGEKIALFIKSADCIPLLFFAPEQGVRGRNTNLLYGALHVSRRSLFAGIISESLRLSLEKLSLSPASIGVFFGPHIRARHYEIKEDILENLPPRFRDFVKKINDKYFFDLTAAAKAQLAQIGVKEENIIDCGIDTFADRSFFSYRRGERNKLFITLIKSGSRNLTGSAKFS